MDEGGGFSPISLPVEAASSDTIRRAIRDGVETLNGFNLPNSDMFDQDEFPGEILTVEEWFTRRLNYLEFE